MKFRYEPSRGLSYEEQGRIWFTCKAYKKLPEETRQAIMDACAQAGRENVAALFEYMTTMRSKQDILMRHYIASETTLHRMVREFYRIVKI